MTGKKVEMQTQSETNFEVRTFNNKKKQYASHPYFGHYYCWGGVRTGWYVFSSVTALYSAYRLWI